MKTPLDTALRVQLRTVETIRIAISVEIAHQMDVEQTERRLIEEVRLETALSIKQALPASSVWLDRTRQRRGLMRAEVESSGARVAALRAQAAAAYGAMRVIEDAATRHRDEAEREIDDAEQARLDDFSAARLFRARPRRLTGRIA